MPISASCSGRRVEHEIGPFGDDVEVIVGDECRDLDDDVTLGFEAGHLQIHPRKHECDTT